MKSDNRLLLVPILFFYLLLVTSCSNKHEHQHQEEHGHEHNEEHAHAHESNAVVLNNGEKWEANPETTEGINNMISIIGEFDGEDFSGLKGSLEAEFQNIFARCTMTGEAHNQLHNYLFPMKDMFEGLGSEDESQRMEKFEELEDHLHEYNSFFE